jgi:hypothetical protein
MKTTLSKILIYIYIIYMDLQERERRRPLWLPPKAHVWKGLYSSTTLEWNASDARGIDVSAVYLYYCSMKKTRMWKKALRSYSKLGLTD